MQQHVAKGQISVQHGAAVQVRQGRSNVLCARRVEGRSRVSKLKRQPRVALAAHARQQQAPPPAAMAAAGPLACT